MTFFNPNNSTRLKTAESIREAQARERRIAAGIAERIQFRESWNRLKKQLDNTRSKP
jgi:hypothetical protein